MKKVLITDSAWENLDPERTSLAKAGAELLVASVGHEEELIQLAPKADGILTCWKKVSRSVIHLADRCLAIGRYGIGLDNIDVNAATTLGIVVTNVPAYCLDEVSDHAIALLLACSRKIVAFDRAIKSGLYDLKAESLSRLRGRTLGIFGFGRIGKAVAQKAHVFGLQVLVCDPLFGGASAFDGVEAVPFESLLRRSDYFSIHVPSTATTRRACNEHTLALMKPSAFLINTARGDVIDEAALLSALDSNGIAGVALDVLVKEPPDAGHALLQHPRVVATPHAAFYSEESLQELQITAASQVAAILRGELPENIVNPEVLQQANLRAVFKS